MGTGFGTRVYFIHRFANALVYYGVTYGSVDLGGDRYLSAFLISVVEIPSNLAYIWSSHR